MSCISFLSLTQKTRELSIFHFPNLAFILHRGLIQYAVRRAFLFPAEDLQDQYPELVPTPGTSSADHLKETWQLFGQLMNICKQSIMVHISNFLGMDHHYLTLTRVGHALSTRFHWALMSLGDKFFHPPWGRKWCEMLALSDYLEVCVGSEEVEEHLDSVMQLNEVLSHQNSAPNRAAAPAA